MGCAKVHSIENVCHVMMIKGINRGDLVDETSYRNLGSKEDKDVEEQLV